MFNLTGHTCDCQPNLSLGRLIDEFRCGAPGHLPQRFCDGSCRQFLENYSFYTVFQDVGCYHDRQIILLRGSSVTRSSENHCITSRLQVPCTLLANLMKAAWYQTTLLHGESSANRRADESHQQILRFITKDGPRSK